METRRWINQSQPQTLYMATILLYISAVISLIFGGFLSVIGLLFIAGEAGAGYGIANERRWGYILGVVVVGIQVGFIALGLVLSGLTALFNIAFLIAAIFPVALLILLLHPMSRDYQRIWFK
jgi:hypothetical protein